MLNIIYKKNFVSVFMACINKGAALAPFEGHVGGTWPLKATFMDNVGILMAPPPWWSNVCFKISASLVTTTFSPLPLSLLLDFRASPFKIHEHPFNFFSSSYMIHVFFITIFFILSNLWNWNAFSISPLFKFFIFQIWSHFFIVIYVCLRWFFNFFFMISPFFDFFLSYQIRSLFFYFYFFFALTSFSNWLVIKFLDWTRIQGFTGCEF
jgi:hypothetical protein